MKLIATLIVCILTCSLLPAKKWSIVVLPDTQYYPKSPANAVVFDKQTEWIKDNVKTRNIQFVLHEGDIVDKNTEAEWKRAKLSMRVLDGVVPYVLSTGNHDYGPRGRAKNRMTLCNDHFTITDNPLSDPAKKGSIGGVFEKGKLDNSYHTFTAPDGRKLIVISLEWLPRDAAVAWANKVVARYPDHTAILLNHYYLDGRAKRHEDSPGHLAGGTNSGQQLWDKLVGVHDNFQMTFSGHVVGINHSTSVGSGGQDVTQMLFNTQNDPNGGNGWLRLLEFDGDTVKVITYSPWLKEYRKDARNSFTFKIKPHVGSSEKAGKEGSKLESEKVPVGAK